MSATIDSSYKLIDADGSDGSALPAVVSFAPRMHHPMIYLLIIC
ncbi:hypothetical protein RR46_06615 [Papilio xuthus]|uniref:Uncharacterized protein n=1 Tax=Papilio xuthus TaxID=66420 RepID=A0A194PN51_PAPXU|nr:hypothetical protein RR46_06615 [Papilio xuthus]